VSVPNANRIKVDHFCRCLRRDYLRLTRIIAQFWFPWFIPYPLYSSLLFLAWGVLLKSPSWLGAGLAIAATAFLTAAAKVEEDENTRYFGAAYREYMKQTKMFIPFLF
jgi:protein-S-isoprenylcysteine O-methyltransferase Ste14